MKINAKTPTSKGMRVIKIIPDLDITEKIHLSIFDLRGREIALLINGFKPPGSYKFRWNATKHSSGVYFARLRMGDQSKTQKIILMK